MHLPNNDSKHRCRKTFTKQNLDISGYQFVIHEDMNFAEYKMSYRGAAGKAFSAPMPIYIAFFELTGGEGDIFSFSFVLTFWQGYSFDYSLAE